VWVSVGRTGVSLYGWLAVRRNAEQARTIQAAVGRAQREAPAGSSPDGVARAILKNLSARGLTLGVGQMTDAARGLVES